MRLPWRKTQERPVPHSLREARKARAAAEQRLAEAEIHIAVPLRSMREQNHVFEAIEKLIQSRVEQETR